MGLERFQDNFREWLERAFHDRPYILGHSQYSRETGCSDKWPKDRAAQIKETRGRIYDLYNPKAFSDSEEKTLESRIVLGSYRRILYYGYSKGGSSGYDSDFLVFASRPGVMKPGRIHLRLYFHFDHTDPDISARVVREWVPLYAIQAHGVVGFKVAGPKMHPDRMDSAVLYLDASARLTWTDLVERTCSWLPCSPGTPYGTREVRPGAGIAREPESLRPGSWQLEYCKPHPSFGALLSVYIARAIRGNIPNVEALADAVADLMEADGIDPTAIHELSPRLRTSTPPATGATP